VQMGTGGHGLRGMRERALGVSGWLDARVRPDGGFEVVARLPTTPSAHVVSDHTTAFTA